MNDFAEIRRTIGRMKKITPAMQHILDMMRKGWELRQSEAVNYGSVWLDNRKTGGYERVLPSSVIGLLKRGLIQYRRSFPVGTYAPTERGKSP